MQLSIKQIKVDALFIYLFLYRTKYIFFFFYRIIRFTKLSPFDIMISFMFTL